MNMKKFVLASTLGFAVLTGSNFPGVEISKASAASINLDTIEGRVVEVVEGAIYIESKEYNGSIDNVVQIILENPKNTFQVGDQVKATGTLWRNMSIFMRAQSVEKMNDNNSLTSGIHYDQQGTPKYVVGTITKQYNFSYDTNNAQDFVVVTYPNKEGNPLTVHVAVSSKTKYIVGDTVRVNNILEWFRTDHFETDEINIEKVNEMKTTNGQEDRWIWS
ncbi:TPA: ATP synthase F0F1 subunit alpha [Bacillus cereus]|nr:ATP synthase F0F1 subunit alpha [Bacillus cereus]